MQRYKNLIYLTIIAPKKFLLEVTMQCDLGRGRLVDGFHPAVVRPSENDLGGDRTEIVKSFILLLTFFFALRLLFFVENHYLCG